MSTSLFSRLTHTARLSLVRLRHPALREVHSCPVCHSSAKLLDAVDFSKSCLEAVGRSLSTSSFPVYYYFCETCGFCFAPQFHSWTFEDFEHQIYNDDYVVLDPDYLERRPRNNAISVDALLGSEKHQIRHLDYGGGSGLLSEILTQRGWNSQTYDPFVDRTKRATELGSFELVTAFEVFEHVPDIGALFADLGALCKPEGLIFFSTLLSDGHILPGQRLRWWYASPRNGHISLFSTASLAHSLQREGFSLASFSAGMHLAYRVLPTWAHRLVTS